LNNVARYYGEIYDLDNALKYFTRSLNVNRKINYKYGTALGLNNIATIHFYKGEYGRALDCENEAETMGRNARMMEIILRCQILKARIFRVRKKYGASLKLFKNTIDLAESRKMEEIRRTALVHYVNTAIEEKNKKRLAAAAKYIPQLKMGLRFEPDDYFKCLSLVALIKYDIASRMVARAWKKLSILSGIVKKTGDQRFVSEIHMIRAQINIATGKEYRPDLKKAEALAKKINLMYLLDEIAAIRRGA
jgi:tetratricopeptide (TPR) repeat protein